MISLLLALKFGGPVLGSAAGAYGLASKRAAYKDQKRLEKLELEARSGKFLSQFTKQEIALTVSGYIQPSCSPTDPSNTDDEAYLSDIREPVFGFMDRAMIASDHRAHAMLLADSGMGKTSFCIAYRHHLLKNRPDQDVAVVSLSQANSDAVIREIPNKSSCILLLDALDEDPKAINDGRQRLDTLLETASEFQSSIITCRSQFFSDDHAIPVETPIRRLGPRPHGQNQNLKLKRFYLSPFDDGQVTRYINRHFPRWDVRRLSQRRRAFKLVSDIPELAARPMLLERLPEIARGDENLRELYQLYDFMVAGWAERERNWIPEDKLLAVSREIAVDLFAKNGHRNQRITKQDLQKVADRLIHNDPDWNHLQTRSLLNRDSNGFFKFAHLSIMEFLVVQAAIAGDVRALTWPWTAFMKQLFISWGYYKHTANDLVTARSLLLSPEARTAILPLADYWALPPKQGLPNFKMSATRRSNEFGGSRLAIPQWRDAHISVTEADGQVTIEDREFFLNWRTYTKMNTDDVQVPMTLARAQQITQLAGGEKEVERLRLPSYDEFISIVEGLGSVGRSDLIEDHTLYPISDSPGEKRHLLVSLGRAHDASPFLKVLDKERSVSATERTITCYETGQVLDPRYANKLKVRPWWIVSR
jgi:hypothetical protein